MAGPVLAFGCSSEEVASSGALDAGIDAPTADVTADAAVAVEAGADVEASVPPLDLGVTFSPVGFGGPAEAWLASRAAFYEARRDYGRVVAYHFNWRDEASPRPPCGTAPGIFQLLDADTKAQAFTLSIVLGWSSGIGVADLDCAPDGGAAGGSWTSLETRAAFKAVAVDAATRYRPAYLFLGNEVNTWYLASHPAAPGEWAAWVSELDDVAKAVRAASPTTLVGTTFQWEHLRGGGANNGWKDPPQWSLLTDMGPLVDVMGITTYPYFDYASPSLVPDGYFDDLVARYPGPIAITETAWREVAKVPYPGGADDQARWPGALFARLPPERIRYSAWLFFNEALGDLGPFASTGLRDPAGKPRAVDAAWKALVTERQRP